MNKYSHVIIMSMTVFTLMLECACSHNDGEATSYGAAILTFPVWYPALKINNALRGDTPNAQRVSKSGYPASMDLPLENIAASQGADSIRSYVEHGRKFSDGQDKDGWTSEMLAVLEGSEAIQAYAEVGGPITDKANKDGNTAAMFAVDGGVETIKVFSAVGGTFTDQKNNQGLTAALIAEAKGQDVLAAYDLAVEKQGGVRHAQTQ